MQIAISNQTREDRYPRTAAGRGLRVRVPRAFTLVEALAAISLAAIAASALLLGISSSLQTTDDAMRGTIAQGMAQQLIDEAMGRRGTALAGASDFGLLGPSAAEAAGHRAGYDDADDFNGFRSQPPTDPYGVPLGTEDVDGDQRDPAFRCRDGAFQNWRQEIDVYYVNNANWNLRLDVGQRSDFIAVEARIVLVDSNRGDRALANRRVVLYVPQ